MAAASTTSDPPVNSTEGPVLSFINKRIRALRKKQNRIVQMEEALSQGKTLNKEQQETLRSKPGVFALIDELEKLRAPLSVAVDEEVSLALQGQQPPSSAGVSASDSAELTDPTFSGEGDSVEDLLNLLYFGSLFDVMPQSDFTSMMLTRTHERGCCLTYDYVTDDATDLLLREKDLDLIAALKGLMISRPLSATLSHKNALQRCIEHAKLWLANSDQPISSETNVTYVGLREKLSKILSSDYYTTTPEMRGSVEMAAAAGVASFGSFQVPIHGSVISVSMPVQPQESSVKYQQEEQQVNHEEYEVAGGEHGSIPVEEFSKQQEEENAREQVSSLEAEQEMRHGEVEQENRELEAKDESQYGGRRGYQNNRGRGGRGRGYSSNGRGGRGSGRGGGSYQNGRGGQYYDQGGNYYPRNNNNNNYRGGGRGGGGGGRGANSQYNYNQSSGVQGGAYTQSNVGSAS